MSPKRAFSLLQSARKLRQNNIDSNRSFISIDDPSDLEQRSLDSTGPESAFPPTHNDESYFARLQAAIPAALEAVNVKEEKP